MTQTTQKEYARYLVFDIYDRIIWDSDNYDSCILFIHSMGISFLCRGIFDTKEDMFIREFNI